MSRRPLRTILGLALAACSSGCLPPGVEDTYGRSTGRSLNGASALAAMVRDRGHSVRPAIRLNRALAGDVDTLVRFAPYSGPPDAREAKWYANWLAQDPDRRLVYVARDYDATADYWTAVLKGLPPAEGHPDRARARKLRDEAEARDNAAAIPAAEVPLKDPLRWFRTEPAKKAKPGVDLGLGGWWADGVDARAAALPARNRLIVPALGTWSVPLQEGENVLACTGEMLGGSGAVLVVANGSFLLNGALLNRARRPLAAQVVDWIDEGGPRVVFVEGNAPRGGAADKDPDQDDAHDDPADASAFALLGRPPIGMIVAHFLGFGLLACLYLGTRLGRPRAEPPPDVGRPSAHAEALGDLLARARQPEAARDLLDAYRRRRTPDRPSSP